MLKIIDITKEYKVDEDRVLALDKVSIEFRKNEFVSILGPSGCGKTTLLNIIGGLDRYTSGDVQIDGISTKQYDDVDWDTYRNRRVGFVFQSYNLIPHMNILKNVAMSLTLAGVEREERRRRALEALAKVGLDTQAKKKPNQLSGGQMQRVAIARALVNNPEIILADEPTGALDSESGLQVMDLLKEVAEDRLVIMVTHNPMLAEQYSTRIVYLKDGRVEGDTMPYDSAAEEEENRAKEALAVNDESADDGEQLFVEGEAQGTVEAAESAQNAIENEENNCLDAQNASENAQKASVDEQESSKTAPSGKIQKIKRTLKEKFARLYNQEKSSMKLRTAIDLSWNNLLSKKGRTLLTSIAGSIGIIGIILVLALSNGAGIYINSLEENALSTYPIEITTESADIQSIMSLLLSSGAQQDESFDEDVITTQKVLGNMIEAFSNGSMTHTNDIKTFKKYLDKNFDGALGTVKYQYGTLFNVYSPDPNNAERYMKVNPYTDVMDTIVSGLGNMAPIIEEFINRMDITALMGLTWTEMSDNRAMLESQYQLVGEDQGSRWPTEANEIVIVVNEYNRLLDYQLFILGLKSQDDLIKALIGDQTFLGEADYSIEELLGLRYKAMTNADYLVADEQSGSDTTWTMRERSVQDVDFINEHAVDFDLNDPEDNTDIKVVGIVRPKPGTIATSIGGCVGYTSKLTQYLQKHSESHPAVTAMQDAYQDAIDKGENTYNSVVSLKYAESDTILNIGDSVPVYNSGGEIWHGDVMRELGDVDLEDPSRIEIYCNSFDSKNAVIEFIDQYNELNKDDPELTIQYTDSLSTMMRFIDTMANTITGVLVAFAAISLVVSTIMIAIIIYTSVLERRKEIGVLRSIGARKKDISRVFLAESAILGGYSGLIGIIVSFILSLIGSKVLELVFNITGLMTINWWHCLVMFAISVVLSMLAGFIPSRIAAKKDPAIALRSE